MKTATKYLYFHTKKKRQLINITGEVYNFCRESEITEGFILISAMHITASVFVNDDEPGLHKDIEKWLEGLAPEGPDYNHHKTGETNGDAHLKNLLLGHEVIVPITGGEPDLGPWQRIFYYEFDGQRTKRVILKAIGA